MSSKANKFCIIMPAHNEELYVARAIRSVLRQTLEDLILVVINDGSDDKTGEIANAHAAHDSRVVIIHPGRVGKVAAFNRGVAAVRADWYYFMGADDELPRDALESWAQWADRQDPDRRVAVCARLRMVSDLRKYDGLVLPKGRSVMNWSGPLALLSRGMMQVVAPIPEHYPNEDTWWTLCIEAFAEVSQRIDAVVVLYSVHSGNSISRSANYAEFSEKYHTRMKAIDEFILRYQTDLSSEQLRRLHSRSRLEAARHHGGPLAVLKCSGVGIKERMRALGLSSPSLYRLKMGLDRWALGH